MNESTRWSVTPSIGRALSKFSSPFSNSFLYCPRSMGGTREASRYIGRRLTHPLGRGCSAPHQPGLGRVQSNFMICIHLAPRDPDLPPVVSPIAGAPRSRHSFRRFFTAPPRSPSDFPCLRAPRKKRESDFESQ